MNIDFEKDQKLDDDFLKEILAKEKNNLKVADLLTTRFTKKYGAEFGGFVKVDCDVVTNKWTIHYGKWHTETIDKDDIKEMPENILRMRLKRKKEMK